MVNIIILEVYTMYPWPARSFRDTEEIALNLDHIVGISTNTKSKYPGACILLDNDAVLFINESEENVQNKMQHPHFVESDDFIMIEHWENNDDDRIWISRNVYEDLYATTTSFDLWSRP